jgi:D-alanine--poly(phosphoribitol) ligase subunit 1
MRFCFDKKDFVDVTIQTDKIAIYGEDRTVTWLELQTEVNQFCEVLQLANYQSSKNPFVIYGHKQVDFIVAVYTCIKLEITYIPIDVIYPTKRLQRVLEIAYVGVIINCTNTPLNLSFIHELILNKGKVDFLYESHPTFEKDSQLDKLIYIIFTSGSTGEPKGVQISTTAVQSFIRWMSADFGFTSDDVFVNIAIFSFDLSVYELLSFSALGASIMLNSKSTIENPDYFLDRLEESNATIWVSTPSFSFMFSRMASEQIKNNIKFFLFCGEMLPNILAKTLKKNYPAAKIYNTYGPTEATVATTLVEITDEIIEKYNPLPVGFSKRESQLLLDEEEIVIVGPNVSLGYLNRPDLNEAKFIQINGERAFKTGDLGYFKDEMLFCKGRNDDQIKLHGYRIELNEITAKIEELNTVVKAETIALKRNEEVKKIVSLVEVEHLEKAPTKESILKYLAKSLPIYMIPSDIKFIEKMPLNQNGKADKKALQEIYLNK